jgi:hypothetical protein
MAADRLAALWEQRLGADATSLLRRRARLGLVLLAGLILIVVAAAVLQGALYYVVAALLVLGEMAFYIVGVGHLNRKLASALADHVGLPVSPGHLPPFRRTGDFDRWLENQRSGAPPRESSFFGGFVRVRLPPK